MASLPSRPKARTWAIDDRGMVLLTTAPLIVTCSFRPSAVRVTTIESSPLVPPTRTTPAWPAGVARVTVAGELVRALPGVPAGLPVSVTV